MGEFSNDLTILADLTVPEYLGWNGTPEVTAPGSNATSTITITPPGGVSPTAPAGMRGSDLCFVICQSRSAATWSVGVDGGQTWEEIVFPTAPGASLFWCTFDGTWDAAPRFDSTSGTCTTAVMHAFRFKDDTIWQVDVALNVDSFSAPGSPFEVTRAGVTTNSPNALVVVGAMTLDDNNWLDPAIGVGEWSLLGYAAHRNAADSDMSLTTWFKVRATPGATGDAVFTQTGVTGDAGQTFSIAFSPVNVASLTPACSPTPTRFMPRPWRAARR